MPHSTLISASAPDAIPRAVAALHAGQLVGLPTETVYGLAADATSGAAVAAIYAAKGRPQFNPLIAHVADMDMARRIGLFDARAEALAQAFWPGPLTLVLPIAPDCPVCELARAGLASVAIRMPADETARAVIAAFGKPVAAPSANRSGHISATTAAHVAQDLGQAVATILDAGPCAIGVESTILGLIDDDARLLRPGGVSRGEIEAVLGTPLAAPRHHAGQLLAPGMMTSHYAPNARVRLDVTQVMAGEALVAFGPALPSGHEQAYAVRNLSLTGDLNEAAAHLFETLRSLDALGPHTIAIAPIPVHGLGEAIRDRLLRAAADRD